MAGAKKKAEAIPSDPDQNATLKTRKLDGSSVEAWVNSPGLRPPK
jgi:hypothetical protein